VTLRSGLFGSTDNGTAAMGFSFARKMAWGRRPPRDWKSSLKRSISSRRVISRWNFSPPCRAHKPKMLGWSWIYSGVGIFNWYYLTSPPQILRCPEAPP
jgi:hypothetical protein